MTQDARDWCTGMTQRDGMGREVGGGSVWDGLRLVSSISDTGFQMQQPETSLGVLPPQACVYITSVNNSVTEFTT